MNVVRAGTGRTFRGAGSAIRELVRVADTGGRWGLVEVTAEPDDAVATHVHSGEPEAFIVLDGEMELHGRDGVTIVRPGDVVFVPPDTEHGLRTPNGGRWLAIWPPALEGLIDDLEAAGGDREAIAEARSRHGMAPGRRYRAS